MVQRFVSLVIDCSASLNCTASVIKLFGPAARHDETAPDSSTGRLWLLRIGLAALLGPKVVADDWVWMTQQTGFAFLVPPSQRSKSRFMNLGDLVTLRPAPRALERDRRLRPLGRSERSLRLLASAADSSHPLPRRGRVLEGVSGRPSGHPGAVLDAMVGGLPELASVHLAELPRMADYAIWG